MIGFAHEIDRTIDVVVSFDDIDMRALIPIVRRCQALMDRRLVARASRINVIASSALSRIGYILFLNSSPVTTSA
jgi:hypothetical protein